MRPKEGGAQRLRVVKESARRESGGLRVCGDRECGLGVERESAVSARAEKARESTGEYVRGAHEGACVEERTWLGHTQTD